LSLKDLPIVTDVHEALKSDAILLHPERNSNEFVHYRIRKGSISEGLIKRMSSSKVTITRQPRNTPTFNLKPVFPIMMKKVVLP